MIVPAAKKREVGEEVHVNFTPIEGVIRSPRKATIIRIATKEEFLEFWKDNANFQAYQSMFGPVPENCNFYEVKE